MIQGGVLLLAILFPVTLMAQEKTVRFRRHEFSAKLGLASNLGDKELERMADSYKEKYDVWGYGDSEYFLDEVFATLNLEYYYRLTPRLSVGLMAGYGYAEADYNRDYYGPSELYGMEGYVAKRGEAESSIYFAGPAVKYNWFLHGKFRMYSGLALGVMHQHTSYEYHSSAVFPYSHYYTMDYRPESEYYSETTERTKWKAVYQLTPFGFDFGIDPIRVFSEWGYGCQGVFTIGARIGL